MAYVYGYNDGYENRPLLNPYYDGLDMRDYVMGFIAGMLHKVRQYGHNDFENFHSRKEG